MRGKSEANLPLPGTPGRGASGAADQASAAPNWHGYFDPTKTQVVCVPPLSPALSPEYVEEGERVS